MRAIHLHPDDPIAIVTGDTASGETILWEGGSTQARQAIGRYHKVAIRALAQGETILRYGAPIGIATQPIAPGDWVHLHNLQSTWLPTYTREENKVKV